MRPVSASDGNGLLWRLRRVAGDLRQVDVSTRIGISVTRYSAIERNEDEPTDDERRIIEAYLPPLPVGISQGSAPTTGAHLNTGMFFGRRMRAAARCGSQAVAR